MPTLVSDIVTEAAMMVGDPRVRRVTPEDQLILINRAQRMVIEKMVKVLESEATFNVEVADKYFYPNDHLQTTSMWFNIDPSTNPTGYKLLNEIHSEEWSARLDGRAQDGDPTSYYPRRGFFQLLPVPTAPVLDGGKIIYWRYPAILASITGSVTLETPTHLDRLVIDAFVVRTFTKLRMYPEAQEAMARFDVEISEQMDVATDRGDDLRQSVRPRSWIVGNSDQI